MKSKRLSSLFLLLGLVFLTIAFITDQTVFSWIAIVSILISLVTGGRWMRRRK